MKDGNFYLETCWLATWLQKHPLNFVSWPLQQKSELFRVRELLSCSSSTQEIQHIKSSKNMGFAKLIHHLDEAVKQNNDLKFEFAFLGKETST